jgi:hypothetical protein
MPSRGGRWLLVAGGLVLVPALALLLRLALQERCAVEENPSRVSFGGQQYDVVYAHAGSCPISVQQGGRELRCLGDGTLVSHDFDADGTKDLAIFTDDRDGFRRTFAYLDIFADRGAPLEQAAPVQGKWKDARWIWIEPRDYPGLDPTSPAGACFQRFVERRR